MRKGHHGGAEESCVPVHQLGSRRFDPAQGWSESGPSSEEAVDPAGQTVECESTLDKAERGDRSPMDVTERGECPAGGWARCPEGTP